MPNETIEIKQFGPPVSPREIVVKYVRFLPGVIISVAIMLVLAWAKLRYSVYIYNVSGKLYVTNQVPYSNQGEKFDDIFMNQRSEKINDEIEMIRSRSIAGRVVRSLGLQKQVINKGKIRSSIVHSRDVPFNFEILEIRDSSVGFSVTVALENDGQYKMNEQPKKYFMNEVVQLSNAKFRITPNGKDWRSFGSNEFQISWQPLEIVAASMSGKINVARVNDFTNMLSLSYNVENTKLGIDIVNQYMREYQENSLEDKREIAARTLQFIANQLDTVFVNLGGVERNLQDYRERRRIVNPDKQSELFLLEMSEGRKELADLGVKMKITDYLINYLRDEGNQHKIIPSMLGNEEPALFQQVTEYNRLQLERETVLKNTPGNNPRVINYDVLIEKLRNDMIETMRNIKQTQILANNELTKKYSEANQQINSIPSKEKQLLEVRRQQDILQELYSYLLQKKLETSIASASTISNIKVVESAMASGGVVSPNAKMLYLFAVLLGVGIPAGIVFLMEYLNDKVRTKSEIEQMTDAPILGEIGHAEQGGTLVVTRNSRKFMAEQFRIIRSNIKYILPKSEKPVLLVTSSFSGEGKSFVSTNLGSVLALSGRRTVILEFDIRKPKIMQGLGLHERKGLTNYIVGSISLQDVIYPVTEVDNLYVIPCGPVPPNPAEMLLNEKIEQLFGELRKQFDAIIIDSAPVGLVSDAITLGNHADGTVYIVRHNYTLKKQIQLIDDLYRNNKLPHLSIIINDITARASGYGYGYYGYGKYGNGYGYGYGYGVNYFEEEDKPKRKKGLKQLLTRFFG